MLTISGSTRLLGVLGWPVAHSLSPTMHNAALATAGIDAVYLPLPVKPDEFEVAVRGMAALGFVGANVTIPHKLAAHVLADSLTDEARLVGAVNTLRFEDDGRISGHNTDCLGVIEAATAEGAVIRGATVLVIGAGGAARAAAVGCGLAGARQVHVLNRTHERAAELVEELRRNAAASTGGTEWFAARDPGEVPLSKVAVVMQMSSAGMAGVAADAVALDVSVLPRGCHVVEAVYSPLETPLLRAARAKGLRTSDGLSMLVAQGALAFEFWFGRKPERRAMREAIDAALGRRASRVPEGG